MLISYMTKMMMMFSGIIVVGLFLTWVNDGLEHLLSRFRYRKTPARQVNLVAHEHLVVAQPTPVKSNEKVVSHKPVLETPQHDYAGKIVKIDLAPRSRATQDETGDKLGEHVTVLPKAA
jgi:hypothetical protein